MNNKVNRILRHLYEEWLTGWYAYNTFALVQPWINEEGIYKAQLFLAMNSMACEQVSILSLAKILLKNEDSVDIYYLLNCIRNESLHLLIKEKRDSLKRDILIYEKAIKNLNILKSGELAATRDKRIAHIDREFVNSPNLLGFKPHVKPEHVLEGYEVVYGIISACCQYYEISIISEERIMELNNRLQEESQYLRFIIRQNKNNFNKI